MTVRYISLSTRSTYLLPICLILLLATFAQSYPATFLSVLNFSLLALCQKNPTPKLISWHTAKKSQLGAGTYLYCTYKILHRQYICTSNMPDQQKFAEFYSTIRSHFSSNTWDYEKFKNNKNNRSKVEFLMCHEASALKSEKDSNLGKA